MRLLHHASNNILQKIAQKGFETKILLPPFSQDSDRTLRIGVKSTLQYKSFYAPPPPKQEIEATTPLPQQTTVNVNLSQFADPQTG